MEQQFNFVPVWETIYKHYAYNEPHITMYIFDLLENQEQINFLYWLTGRAKNLTEYRGILSVLLFIERDLYVDAMPAAKAFAHQGREGIYLRRMLEHYKKEVLV